VEAFWKIFLEKIEALTSRQVCETWFRPLNLICFSPEKISVSVPRKFFADWINENYKDIIDKALLEATGFCPVVAFSVSQKDELATKEEYLCRADNEEEKKILPKNINPLYTFQNFVVGPSNQFAHAACRAISNNPGATYNPLFIYGGVGLGKTHLLHAILHESMYNNPKNRSCYVTSEQFTNELINSIRYERMASFREKYRNIDFLLIDDIQFIAGKERTQEEFFHTFNALHQNNKQIVISSDRPPKAIPGVESRLISRFEWGMIADISFPDLETRMAILEIKCQEKGYFLDKEIISFIAQNIQENIRELEGALNRIIAFHQLNNTKPSLESVRSILGGISANPKKAGLTVKKLLAVVANFYGIDLNDLLGTSRKKELVVPRQISMFLMREELKSSYPNIGQGLGGRDHTTAMHACLKISQAIDNDEKIKNDVAVLKQKIYE